MFDLFLPVNGTVESESRYSSPSFRTNGLESFSSALCVQEIIIIEIRKEINSLVKL